MAPLTVVTYLWGRDKYGHNDVDKLAAGVKRHLSLPHQFAVISDWTQVHKHRTVQIPEPDRYLTKTNGCFARLRLFDPQFQEQVTDSEGGRIVCIDLDTVIVGPLDELFSRRDPFTILQNINTTNPCPYNGSVWMLDTWYRPDVWTDFSLEAAEAAPYHSFPDDQGWFWHKLPDAAAYGPADGVYGFKKLGWPDGDALPDNAKIVAFPGWRSPLKFEHLPWVKENWRP